MTDHFDFEYFQERSMDTEATNHIEAWLVREGVGFPKLTPEQEAALEKLRVDYKAAVEEYVPGYTGGLSHRVAVALIQAGWRR